MKVLEVGPWDYPADGYLAHPALERYVGVDFGVWEGSIEGNRADEVFDNALLRNGVSGQRAEFYRMPVSALRGDEFDIVYAANVSGDPIALPKNSDGTFKYPGEEDRILADALRRLVSCRGTVQIVETYTPLRREVLFDLMGQAGLSLDGVLEGSELMDFLSQVHVKDWEKMQKRLDPMNRPRAALRFGIEDGIDTPYAATFRLSK
jgi:hypothetical protein